MGHQLARCLRHLGVAAPVGVPTNTSKGDSPQENKKQKRETSRAAAASKSRGDVSLGLPPYVTCDGPRRQCHINTLHAHRVLEVGFISLDAFRFDIYVHTLYIGVRVYGLNGPARLLGQLEKTAGDLVRWHGSLSWFFLFVELVWLNYHSGTFHSRKLTSLGYRSQASFEEQAIRIPSAVHRELKSWLNFFVQELGWAA